MSLGLGDEPVDSVKNNLSYEGGNLYALDDEGMEVLAAAGLVGGVCAEEQNDYAADPLGLGCVECASVSSGESDGRPHRWAVSPEGRARDARKRAQAERLKREFGTKLDPEFRFGPRSSLPAPSEPCKFGPDFQGPA